MKRTEMKYEPFICTIIFYLILCTRFKKVLLMLLLREELLTFARDCFSYRSLLAQIINTSISFSCWRLFLTYCILSFLLTLFPMQPQPLFVILRSESGSNNKPGKTKSCQYQSHEGGNIDTEIEKYIVSLSFDDKGLKLNLLN